MMCLLEKTILFLLIPKILYFFCSMTMQFLFRSPCGLSLFPIVACVVSLITFIAAETDAIEPKKLPPVILLTVDDMNWDSVGVYGCPVQETTPNIDRLAKDSIRFDMAFAQASVCTPSRHVMLSGCYSHTTKTEGFVSITPVCQTMPEILKRAGYYTAIINKGVGNYDWDFQTDRKETNHGRDPDIYAKLVEQVYKQASEKDRPLFLMANTMDPHRPFHGSQRQSEWQEISEIIPLLKSASRVYRPDEVTVPKFLPDLAPVREEMAEYYSSVRRADDVVGAVMETLEKLGIADEALILFLSDHGISMPFSKANVYRNSLRIPLMVKLPGNQRSGAVVKDAIVSTVDLTPTTLDLLSLPTPPQVQGHSFKSLLVDDQTFSDELWQYTYGYYYQSTQPGRTPMFTVQDKRFGYIVNLFYGTDRQVGSSDFGESMTWETMIAEADSNPEVKKRVAFHRERTLEELYDYENDPHALNNLINDAAYVADRKRLSAKLDLWMAQTKCDALEAYRNRYELSARRAYAKQEDDESFALGRKSNPRPVVYESESFDSTIASWSPTKQEGVFLVQPNDGKIETLQIDSRPAVRGIRTQDTQENRYLYFHVHDGLTKSDQRSYPMKVRLLIYDKSPGDMLVQYNGLQGSYSNSAIQSLRGDGTWKTLEFSLDQACFDNSQHNGADLRIACKGKAEALVGKITVERISSLNQ
jgi:N-sulfoglucosamine sulfohydrolase